MFEFLKRKRGASTATTTTTGGAATTGIAEPKAFHRQGLYRNNWFNFCAIALSITGTIIGLTAFGLDVAGAAVIGSNGTNVVDPSSGAVLWNPDRYLALWIVAACLTPLILLGAIGSCLCSVLAMRHEKAITRYNNDANQYQHAQRDRSNRSKYLAMIPGALNQLLLLCLLSFYLAVTVVAAYRLQVARSFTNNMCVAGGVSASECQGARRGHRIMLAGAIMTMFGILPFFLLNWAALSHLGSHQRKSNVMPPQAATLITGTTQQQQTTTTATQPAASAVY